MITDKLYSIKEAAPFLGIAQCTLYDYLKEPAYIEKLQPVSMGRKVFIKESVINEVIRSGLPKLREVSSPIRKKREVYRSKPIQRVRSWLKSSEKV